MQRDESKHQEQGAFKSKQNVAEEIDCFTNFGMNDTQDGGGTAVIRKRLALANTAFR